MERIEAHRLFFANLVTASAGKPDDRLKRAFAAVARERFVGPGPWKVFTASGYIDTPSDDPAFLYQDVTVALAPERFQSSLLRSVGGRARVWLRCARERVRRQE